MLTIGHMSIGGTTYTGGTCLLREAHVTQETGLWGWRSAQGLGFLPQGVPEYLYCFSLEQN